MDRILEILQHVEQLWKELERAEPNGAEYKGLMEKIRVLSAEYEAIIDAPKKPRESK